VNSAVLVVLVLLASFALAGAVLSGLVALVWRAVARRRHVSSLELLALRLLPAGGALLFALGVVLPAFLRYEPLGEHEAVGPWLWGLASLAAACLVHGLWRGALACREARTLLERCGPAAPRQAGRKQVVEVVDAGAPLVAVVGAWRPRLVAARSVRAACTPEEFRAVLAHEMAHLAAHDNLKLLALLSAPDPLAWTPLAAGLTARWRAAAEHEADERATGPDRERRLALAAALIKVARLVQSHDGAHAALGMPVAADDVVGRVQELLAPSARRARPWLSLVLAIGAVLLPLLALPGHAFVHGLIECLVALGS
jgi:Zn-dependent protease with chaperone function